MLVEVLNCIHTFNQLLSDLREQINLRVCLTRIHQLQSDIGSLKCVTCDCISIMLICTFDYVQDNHTHSEITVSSITTVFQVETIHI